jgi:hypothetical protein
MLVRIAITNRQRTAEASRYSKQGKISWAIKYLYPT